jgi:uncharacterized protein (TIGR02246 family)
MRNLIACIAVAGLTGCAMSSDLTLADEQRIEQEVQLATDSLLAASGRTDVDAAMAPYAEAMHADNGELMSRAELEEMYAAVYAGLDRIEFTPSVSNVQVLGPDAAVWVGQATYRGFAADTITAQGQMALTLVWERDEGDWRVLHMHQSFVPPEAAG